jgi:hypothetical protein
MEACPNATACPGVMFTRAVTLSQKLQMYVLTLMT